MPGLGVGVAVVVVLLGFYKKIKKSIEDYNKHVVSNANVSRQDEEFKEEMRKMMQEVKDMKLDFQENINRLDKNVEIVTESVEQLKCVNNNNCKSMMQKLSNYEESHQRINKKIDVLHDNMDLILESDREDIRSFITIQYYNAVEKGYIEMYVMEALEHRYEKYLKENGDSFIANLMNEMRKMKHQP